VAAPAGLPERRLLSAGDRAGLLPFGPHAPALADPLATTVATIAAASAVAPIGASAVASRSTETRDAPARSGAARAPDAGGSDPRPAPHHPPTSPGNAGAGGIASAAGGAASSVWCVVLLAGFLLFSPQLRRHSARLVISAPRGVELLLHRPG
jgi:hypothetical protein